MNKTDSRNWKEKYILLLADFETKQSSKNQHIALLQRALVRSILAAEGQDPKLDRSLKDLRSAVRRELDTDRLEQLINEFELRLVDADEKKQLHLGKIQQALHALCDHLLQQKPSSEITQALNRYQAALKISINNSYNLHSLLQELSDLQAQVLSKPAELELNKTSLFNRFLAKQKAPLQPVSTTDEQPDSVAQTELDQPSNSCSFSQTADDHAHAEIVEQIQATLLQLIAELPINHRNQAVANALEKKLQNKIDCFQLADLLDELASLVIAIHSSSHQEIGNYLQQLNQRLNYVNESLQTAQSSYQVAVNVADTFDTQMQSQVKVLNQDVQKSTDLDELKLRVDERLNQFIQSLGNYQTQRKQVEQSVLDRFNSLSERFVLMESETKQLSSKLKEQQEKARLDPLTRIANRAAWDERLMVEHTRLTRTAEPLLLAILDIDLFKRINDNYGHIAGDKVLKIIASKLAKSIRRTDFLARYGGEEFVLLLTDTTLDDGERLLNKIRESIATAPFHFKGEPIQITFSAGIGQLHANEPSEQGFARIDQALYQAKNRGRNMVVRSEPYVEY
ncbi:MAG: diguanylate cyclase [Thiopseudomonas sp.]|nr:diguanylate cyclase [Thiopseudomonas sp.]